MTRVTIDLTQTPPTVRNAYDVSVRDILREHGATWVQAERCWTIDRAKARDLQLHLAAVGHSTVVLRMPAGAKPGTASEDPRFSSAWRDFGPEDASAWDDPHGNDYEDPLTDPNAPFDWGGDPLTRMFQERLRQAKARQQARAEDPNGFYEKLNEEHQQSAHERAQEAQRQRIKDEFFRKMNGAGSGRTFTGSSGNHQHGGKTPPPRPPKGGPRTWADDLLTEAGDLAPVVYKALARVLHPDAGGNTKLMQALNAANDRRKK